jgi:hypothetical protein
MLNLTNILQFIIHRLKYRMLSEQNFITEISSGVLHVLL